MVLTINNDTVDEKIQVCLQELDKISEVITEMGPMSHPVPFLTRYSIVRACGTIEFGFKTLISDMNSHGQSQQVRSFIDKKFRNSSMNPSYNNIVNSLGDFDKIWSSKFKILIAEHEHSERIKDSLASLNQARNSFAHGGNPTITFSNIKQYFNDSIIVLKCLETALEST
jgi:hypothetical protein